VSLVSYDAADLGRTATELILRRLAGDAEAPRRVVLPTTLVVRDAKE
jgi:LacI family transcriptional regulator